MTLRALCAFQWSSTTVDVAVLLGLMIATFICGRKGFISCLFGIVSNLVAFLLAVSLANVFLNITGGLFGLQGLLEGKFEEFFLRAEGFGVDISASGLETALEANDVPAILGRLVVKIADGVDLPAGTTLASLLGDATGSLAATLISCIFVFLLVKLSVFFMRSVLNGVIKKINLLRGLNTLLGSIFGLLYAVLMVCIVLAVFTLIPIASVREFISQTALINFLYEKNLLIIMLSWFL